MLHPLEDGLSTQINWNSSTWNICAAPSPGPIWKLISLPMLSHTGVWEKTWAVESDHSWPKAQLSHHWPGTPENVAEMSSTSVPLICRMGNQGH